MVWHGHRATRRAPAGSRSTAMPVQSRNARGLARHMGRPYRLRPGPRPGAAPPVLLLRLRPGGAPASPRAQDCRDILAHTRPQGQQKPHFSRQGGWSGGTQAPRARPPPSHGLCLHAIEAARGAAARDPGTGRSRGRGGSSAQPLRCPATAAVPARGVLAWLVAAGPPAGLMSSVWFVETLPLTWWTSLGAL